jgi:hypothetical protein
MRSRQRCGRWRNLQQFEAWYPGRKIGEHPVCPRISPPRISLSLDFSGFLCPRISSPDFPPLIITRQQIDQAIDAFAAALQEVAQPAAV